MPTRRRPEPSDVSCVIPTHDRPDLLREAIGSVLDQLDPIGEIVVVTDRADPAIPAVIDEFANAAVPIRLVDRADEALPGVSRSRNTGAAHAGCDWIAFLDDDDQWHPEFSRLMCAKTDGHDFVLGSKQVLDADGLGRVIPARADLTAADVFHDLAGAHGGNILLPRALAGQFPYDEQFQGAEDWDLFYRLLHAGSSYAVVDEPVVLYRIHGPQVSRDPRRGAEMARRLYAKHRGSIDWRARRYLRFRAAWLERRWAPTRWGRVRGWVELALTAPYGRLARKRIRRLRAGRARTERAASDAGRG